VTESNSPVPAYLTLHTVKGEWQAVQDALTKQLAGAGLSVISSVGLTQVAPLTAEIKGGVSLSLCGPALASVLENSAFHAAFCPLTIAVFERPGERKLTYIVYRQLVPLVAPPAVRGVLEAVNEAVEGAVERVRAR
jgi:uncharacterized protein (DUF302 family)